MECNRDAQGLLINRSSTEWFRELFIPGNLVLQQVVVQPMQVHHMDNTCSSSSHQPTIVSTERERFGFVETEPIPFGDFLACAC